MLRSNVCLLAFALLLRPTKGTFTCADGTLLEKRICLPSDYVASQIPGEGTDVDTFMQIQVRGQPFRFQIFQAEFTESLCFCYFTKVAAKRA
jgi:hypothetical protein